jgi:hypothetical protein
MAEHVEIFEGEPRLGNDPGDRFSGERAEPITGLSRSATHA